MFGKIIKASALVLSLSNLAFADSEAIVFKEALGRKFFEPINNRPVLPPPPTLARKKLPRPALGDLKRQSFWVQQNQALAGHDMDESESSQDFCSGTVRIMEGDDQAVDFGTNFAESEKRVREQVKNLFYRLKEGRYSLSSMEETLFGIQGFLIALNNAACEEGKKHRHSPKPAVMNVSFAQLAVPAKAALPTRVRNLIQFWENPTAIKAY